LIGIYDYDEYLDGTEHVVGPAIALLLYRLFNWSFIYSNGAPDIGDKIVLLLAFGP